MMTESNGASYTFACLHAGYGNLNTQWSQFNKQKARVIADNALSCLVQLSYSSSWIIPVGGIT